MLCSLVGKRSARATLCTLYDDYVIVVGNAQRVPPYMFYMPIICNHSGKRPAPVTLFFIIITYGICNTVIMQKVCVYSLLWVKIADKSNYISSRKGPIYVENIDSSANSGP